MGIALITSDRVSCNVLKTIMDQIDFKPVEIADLKKQNFAEIKKQLEEENDNFEDELFPKAMISIGQIQSNPRLANLEWMRPKRIAKKEWEALSDADKFKVGFRNKEDGEFFMTYEDFNKHFDGIDICHVSRDSFCDENLGWHKEEVHGMWE